MSYFEQALINAINDGKITCYEHTSYDRLSCWCKGNREKSIIYNEYFISELPNYYYLGIPIKKIISGNNAMGHCYTCAIALSLCYNNFSILICNLSSYASYLNYVGFTNDLTFNHTVLLVDNDNMVIDTSFGIITDYNTYNKIFKLNRVMKLSSKDLKKSLPFKYLESNREFIGPDFYSKFTMEKENVAYIDFIKYFLHLCEDYKDNNNRELEYYYNCCLAINSNLNTIKEWRNNMDPDAFDNGKIKKR